MSQISELRVAKHILVVAEQLILCWWRPREWDHTQNDKFIPYCHMTISKEILFGVPHQAQMRYLCTYNGRWQREGTKFFNTGSWCGQLFKITWVTRLTRLKTLFQPSRRREHWQKWHETKNWIALRPTTNYFFYLSNLLRWAFYN